MEPVHQTECVSVMSVSTEIIRAQNVNQFVTRVSMEFALHQIAVSVPKDMNGMLLNQHVRQYAQMDV